MIEIPLKFVNEKQERFFFLTERNTCFSGGFGNGKSFVGCLKAIFLASTFPKYKIAIARKIFKDLRRTTMATFFEVCPRELYADSSGGRRSDLDGYCRFINGSEIFFLGLDDCSEQSMKSFEINSALVDQAEELDENSYIMLDSRIGRWKGAEIPENLSNLSFPINSFTGKPMAPSYMTLLCNPDSRLHWIFRRYHEESVEWQEKYQKTHRLINCPSTENPALSPELLETMLTRDPEWVRRYVYGEWGISDSTIHVIYPDSTIEPDKDWLKSFLAKAKKYRVMDHGESSPTVCLWFATWRDFHICYREYYQPNKLISEHRSAIAELSEGEKYDGNYADPAIFKKDRQKNGGRWSVADEYLERSSTFNGIGAIIENKKCPPLRWLPADNNEFPLRNRINELLRLDGAVTHPLTGKNFAPRIYFVKKNADHPMGCYHVIRETQSQRRELLGHENGKPIYSDDRAETVSDHAYDCLRYYCSIKGTQADFQSQKVPVGSFLYMTREIKKLKKAGLWNSGVPSFK